MFVGDTPAVDGNSVKIEFVVGSSFTSVECRITSEQIPVDCKPQNIVPLYRLVI